MKINTQKLNAALLAIATLVLFTETSQAQSLVFPPEDVFPLQPIPAYPTSKDLPSANTYKQMNQPAIPGNFQVNQQPAMQPYQANQANQNYQTSPNPQVQPQSQLQPQIQPQQQTQSVIQTPPPKPEREFSGFLGIILDIASEAVIAQLPDGIKHGVLVKGFSDKAPAASSELKPYDVMFAYDDIKLNHPAQFIKIVRDDKPGREVKIKVVRKGKILEIPLIIGSQKTPDAREFNSLEIKQVGNYTYRAIVRFVGPNGNKQIRSYEGTRARIFEQVLYAQDLPRAERQQLLNATRPINNNSNNGFGNFFPFGGNNYNGNGYNNGSHYMNPRRYFNW